MMRPSFPGAFVVEVTATTLLIQIILPSAPPVICKARIVEVDRLSISAVWYWRGPKSVLETVQEPETKAPKPHGIALDETDDEEEMSWRKEADAFF